MVDMITQKNMQYTVESGGLLSGTLNMPSDKSISHRAVLLGSIAEGTTLIKGFLHAKDTMATVNALRLLGVDIDFVDDDTLRVVGNGLHGLHKPSSILDCGNSGTAIRLLTGVLVGQRFDTILTGDESLQRRPMARIIEPLRKMGAQIEVEATNSPPLYIHGQNSLSPLQYTMPIASAQVKSCLILASLYAQGDSIIVSPQITRDHTERMLNVFGHPLHIKGPKIRVSGPAKLKAASLEIPGDISSAAFFMVGATIADGSLIRLKNIGINSYRIGIINILRLMGANITIENERFMGDEPVADLKIESSRLYGIDIPLDQVPLAIDEFPIIAIAAACAHGVTVIRGAEELHVKESDRIVAMTEGLQRLGINVEARPDGMSIEGGIIQGGTVNSFGDHRIAMAFAMAGLVSENPIKIENCANVATSFPNFVELANRAGLAITQAWEE